MNRPYKARNRVRHREALRSHTNIADKDQRCYRTVCGQFVTRDNFTSKLPKCKMCK